jgi:hypothetical protein
MFFFKKENQEIWPIWPRSIRQSRSPNNQRFFAALFQKKQAFAPSTGVSLSSRVGITVQTFPPDTKK